jgi:(p)ppGpp synthase/HD superfamily hydrolase
MELSRFEDALTFAVRLHSGQFRKGTDIPYIAHLLGVTSIAMEYGATETEAIAAVLHDAAEDQGGQTILDEIERRFGEDVAAIVRGCSDTLETPKPAWFKRKKEHIRELSGSSPSILLVSAADKLYNSRAILTDYRVVGDALWSRFKGKKRGTLWYYRALVEAYRQAGAHPLLVDELDRVVSEIEHLVRERQVRDDL